MSEPGGKKPPDEQDLSAPASDAITSRKEFIQSIFKRAGEFTDEVLRENERLRFRIAQLEADQPQRPPGSSSGAGAAAFRELVARIEDLEREREQIVARFRTVEERNVDYEKRARDIERENNNLANLYVASFQLHSTLDLREVKQIIVEILLNFIGAKVFAVLLLDDEKGVLRPLAAEGIDRARVPLVRPGEGPIGRVAATGETELLQSQKGPTDLERPVVVAPLRIKDRVVGAIVIWELLAQKSGIEDVDHELLNLLGAHAATALLGAKLATELRGQATPLWGAVDLV